MFLHPEYIEKNTLPEVRLGISTGELKKGAVKEFKTILAHNL